MLRPGVDNKRSNHYNLVELSRAHNAGESRVYPLKTGDNPEKNNAKHRNKTGFNLSMIHNPYTYEVGDRKPRYSSSRKSSDERKKN